MIDADEILVLENGSGVERGDQAHLLALGGTYAAMWARQQEALEARVALERAGEFLEPDSLADQASPEPAK